MALILEIKIGSKRGPKNARSFKNTTYRHLFLAQVIALIGTGLITIALALQAYDIAKGEAAQVLGIALAIKMIAYIGVAPIASAFAERLPRKKF